MPWKTSGRPLPNCYAHCGTGNAPGSVQRDTSIAKPRQQTSILRFKTLDGSTADFGQATIDKKDLDLGRKEAPSSLARREQMAAIDDPATPTRKRQIAGEHPSQTPDSHRRPIRRSPAVNRPLGNAEDPRSGHGVRQAGIEQERPE